MSARVTIRHFTDPGCPFAFSAERHRHRLLWLYGDQIEWELHMIVLAEEKSEGWPFGPRFRDLQLRYGMPIDWRERLWTQATVHACRAVVAARLRWPDGADALLRRLRVLNMAGALLDDSDTLELAAGQAGLPVAELAAYCAEPEVEEALRADMHAARALSAAARAQDHVLGGPPEERRYCCPSYEIVASDGRRLDVPGFRPIDAYEVALANLEPSLTRRLGPQSAHEVLAWAGIPLATAEVAAVCDREIPDVRAELARGGARFEPVGADGYWTDQPLP